MSKKLTYEYVKSKFEEEGYELLSTKYINSKNKLKYKCLNGHEHTITWDDFNSGYRCSYCYGNVKYSHAYVKDIFKKCGYTLLSNKYINNKQKLDYVCPLGHFHSVSFISFSKGVRCPTCTEGTQLLTYDFVKQKFEKIGYKLVSTHYINSSTKLTYICPNCHKHSMSWDNWKQGKRCPTCAVLRRSGENCNLWKGGISSEPYCQIWSDKGYKSNIRERDNNICQNPYCYHTTDRLSIHHIDYDKKNCHPSNLITVCIGCNGRANTDRDWHKSWYQTIISRKFGYKY